MRDWYVGIVCVEVTLERESRQFSQSTSNLRQMNKWLLQRNYRTDIFVLPLKWFWRNTFPKRLLLVCSVSLLKFWIVLLGNFKSWWTVQPWKLINFSGRIPFCQHVIWRIENSPCFFRKILLIGMSQRPNSLVKIWRFSCVAVSSFVVMQLRAMAWHLLRWGLPQFSKTVALSLVNGLHCHQHWLSVKQLSPVTIHCHHRRHCHTLSPWLKCTVLQHSRGL
jgi:hypothetical protein